MTNCQIIQADAIEGLRQLPDNSVQCCVTSPPYWGLRDYGHPDQIGLEATPEEFAAKIVAVLREVRRILKEDGTCWVNLGDTYTHSSGSGRQGHTGDRCGRRHTQPNLKSRFNLEGLKSKDLVGIPWMVAFALRADGWYLRQDIIWAKPNPMPESVKDRCTKAHEYIFLLTKSEKYFYDAKAIGEPIKCADRYARAVKNGEQFDPERHKHGDSTMHNSPMQVLTRSAASLLKRGYTNKRTIWTIPTAPYSGAHFATFPPDLIKPCILAGTRPGDVVLDPFAGSGTTGEVALDYGRSAILIELNPEYLPLINRRTRQRGLAL